MITLFLAHFVNYEIHVTGYNIMYHFTHLSGSQEVLETTVIYLIDNVSHHADGSPHFEL